MRISVFLALAASLGACGDASERYLGTWTMTGGRALVMCPGMDDLSAPLADAEVRVSRANDGGLTVSLDVGPVWPPRCALPAKIVGGVLTVVAGASCALNGGQLTATDVTFDDRNYPGKSSFLDFNATFVAADGTSCEMVQTGHADKNP
jgi:hypothetical protein